PILNRRSLIVSGLATTLAGCANRGFVATAPANSIASYGLDALKPLDLSIENLTRITACIRPLRPAGPWLETERRSGKKILHNYGHGGSGWSLAWGYAEAARDLLSRDRPRSVAVLGAGAIGLTTAIAIAETGAKVTIFARDLPKESRSARATGVWSPSSRIALASAVAPDFAARWEALARRSYARHLSYVGRTGNPVEFTPRFYIRSERPEPALANPPPDTGNVQTGDFLELGRQLRGLTPPWREREGTPFPTEAGVRGGLVMTFNIAEYTRQMIEDFLAMGGRIERTKIGSFEEMMRLPGEAIANCSGYEAKMLAGDDSLVPVRGQIAWMVPQSDRLYGIYHRGVMALSRRDGLLIQETGGNDYFGFGDESEKPKRDEFLAAHAKVAPIFDWS
ncbi:MAG: FAD-dependent oxidoreductase, partial [Pseudomonadota bacterium]